MPDEVQRASSPNSGGGGRKQGMGGLMTYLIPIAFTIIAMLYMNSSVLPKTYVKQSDDSKNISGILTDVNSAKASIVTLSNGYQVLVQNGATYAKASDLTNLQARVDNSINAINDAKSTASQASSQVGQINTGISTLTTQLTQAQATIKTQGDTITSQANTIKAQSDTITALDTRVKALETKAATTTSGGTSTDPLTFTINNLGMPITISGNNSSPASCGWQLVVKNNTNTVVDQIILGLQVGCQSSPFAVTWATNPTITSISSSGSGVVWTYQASQASVIYFVSGWGYGASQLSIPAGGTLTLWCTLNIVWPTPANASYTLYPTAFCQSYHQ